MECVGDSQKHDYVGEEDCATVPDGSGTADNNNKNNNNIYLQRVTH